jgi:hypothetical protein
LKSDNGYLSKVCVAYRIKLSKQYPYFYLSTVFSVEIYELFKELASHSTFSVFALFIIPPANKVWGYLGITLSIRPSVRPSVRQSMYLVSATPPQRFIGVL